MNLLIVDDEIRAIQAVQKNVPWQQLDFDQIFTATSKSKAIEIIEANPVDLLLCDIEMPFGSGLELLEWIQAKCLAIRCIFMTCHADFHYAQQALRLGSLDYILKPLDFEKLAQVLLLATNEIARQRQGGSPAEQYAAAAKQFWKDYVVGDIAAQPESIRLFWQQRGVKFDVQQRFLPVLASVKQWAEDTKKEEQKLYLYALRNMAEELFQAPAAAHHVVPLAGDSFLVVFSLPAGPSPEDISDLLKTASEALADAARGYLRTSVCCYVGEPVALPDLPAQLEALQTMDFNNVVLTTHCMLLAQCKTLYREQLRASPAHWRELLNSGEYSKLLREISNTVVQDSLHNSVNRAYLEKVNKEFNFLLYEFASRYGVSIDKLVDYEHGAGMMARALTSMEHFLRWLDFAIARMRGHEIEQKGSAANPVETVKHYIREHLDDELRADAIAAQVNLHPDYLGRIFKREVGIPLNQYVIHLKMHKAKWLMEHSILPISEIAAQVGYFNYSSFNRSFSKEHGMSPQEYKKLLRKG